ncbi:MAG: methylated-DNA--[protein]-cysteine S-methyltransferase, partial [Planctomycetaceae bacterium]
MAKPVEVRRASAAKAADALAVFSTPLGWIGLIGSNDEVLALTFGHETPVAVRRDFARKWCLPDGLREVDWSPGLRARLQAFAAGEPSDFSDVVVRSGHVTPFQHAVLTAVRRIRHGETTSYGALAQLAGYPGAARAVGQVMAANRVPLIVPCHRVIAASGRLGGYSARSGLTMKQRLLNMEQSGGEPAPACAARRSRAAHPDDAVTEPARSFLQVCTGRFS